MAQLEMYPPIINSPTTQLANAIDSTTTSIEVVDGARLPDAPNICTIGRGENPETILYATKVGNVLSGITRGFQGVAQNWQAGTQVARLFTAYDLESLQQNHKTHLAETTTEEDIIVNIPSDYATLQDAVDDLSLLRNIKQGKRVILNIESGHKLTAGLEVQFGNYEHFYIQSEDAIVEVSDDFTGNLIMGDNRATMPVLACVIDMRNKGGDGYHIRHNSSGHIRFNCGVINAGNNGLYVTRGSTVSAYQTKWNGATGRGVWVSRGSVAELENAEINDSGNRGVYVSRASMVSLMGATINNSGSHGIVALRSRISADGATVLNSGGTGVVAENSGIVALNDAVVKGSVGYDIAVNNGGSISATNVETTNGIKNKQDISTYDFNVLTPNGIIYSNTNVEPGLVFSGSQEKLYNFNNSFTGIGFLTGRRLRLRFELDGSRMPYMFYVNFSGASDSNVTNRWALVDKLFVFNINGTGTAIVNLTTDTRIIEQFIDDEISILAVGNDFLIDLIIEHPAAHEYSLARWGLSVRAICGNAHLKLVQAVVEIP